MHPALTDPALPPIRLLLGCTAVGKTEVALQLAERHGLEVVSIDSMQVYRGMDIGTAKPTATELARVPHHLIDVLDPWESCSAARFVPLAEAAIADIRSRGRGPLLVAGTPFYLMALVYGLFDGPSADPEFRRQLRERAASEGAAPLHAELTRIDPSAAGRIHPNDLFRIERALEVHWQTGRPISELQRQWAGPPRFSVRVVGLKRSPEDQAHRINARVKQMYAAGWVDEVKALLGRRAQYCRVGGTPPTNSELLAGLDAALSPQARQALGYSQILRHFAGEYSLEKAIEQTKIATRRFAKSQRTWFRKFGGVNWVELGDAQTAIESLRRVESAAGLGAL